MNNKIFTEKNISSIGGRGRKNTPAILELIRSTLEERRDDLSILMDATGFDAKSISSMLAGAGAHIGTGIEQIYSRREKLKALCTKFRSTEIATRLHGTPMIELGAAVDKMYADLQPELNDNTRIPAGSGAEIADGSLAALAAGRRVGK